MDNVTFINNTAPKGSNIASYPIKLVVNGSDDPQANLVNLASGQAYDGSVTFNLVDYDNQAIYSDEVGTVSINAFVSGTDIQGQSREPLVDGSVTFDDLTFVGKPGDTDVEFSITSDVIDVSNLVKQFGATSVQDPLKASFRYCMPGEIESLNQCTECLPNTYSFIWNSTECHA